MPRTKRVREAQLFPLFLKLRNRPCLVVGAGRVGESKIAGLLAAGAKVRVVAPQATPKVESWARSRKLRWLQREFRAEDLTIRRWFAAGRCKSQSPPAGKVLRWRSG